MGRIDIVPRIEDLVARALRASPQTDPELMAYRYRSLLKAAPDGFMLRQDRRRPNDFPHILGKLAMLAVLAPQVNCPVRVGRGGADGRILTDQTAGRLRRGFPGRPLDAGGRGGHNVQEDNPVDLAAALAAQHPGLRRAAGSAARPRGDGAGDAPPGAPGPGPRTPPSYRARRSLKVRQAQRIGWSGVHQAEKSLAIAGARPQLAAVQGAGEGAADQPGHDHPAAIVEPDNIGGAGQDARKDLAVIAIRHPGPRGAMAASTRR